MPITPAAEWLVDNFHLVERHIRDVRANLPPAFYRLLPKLVAGPFVGCPRVFGIAWAYVAHTDSRFDAEALTGFMRAYQEVQPLTIGELWAVATTLRAKAAQDLTGADQQSGSPALPWLPRTPIPGKPGRAGKVQGVTLAEMKQLISTMRDLPDNIPPFPLPQVEEFKHLMPTTSSL
jgi:hypothetical protein